MSPANKLAVERAIIELANIDDAVVLMANGLRGRVAVALGQLTTVRDAFDNERAEAVARVEAEGRKDVALYEQARRDEGEKDPPEKWAHGSFDSWLADFDGAEAIRPLTEDEARGLYVAAFLAAHDAAESGLLEGENDDG